MVRRANLAFRGDYLVFYGTIGLLGTWTMRIEALACGLE